MAFTHSFREEHYLAVILMFVSSSPVVKLLEWEGGRDGLSHDDA